MNTRNTIVTSCGRNLYTQLFHVEQPPALRLMG